MELVHLQSFLAVYRTRNLTRAAEELHVSQPAVTAHLRALESELKRPLFVRLPRGVTPTSLAEQLAREVTDPLDTLTSVAQGFRPDAELPHAHLLLGGPADLLGEVILPLLAPLSSQGLTVKAQTGLTNDLLRALSSSELDLVVATTPTRTRGITMVPLFDEELALTMSPRLLTKISRSVDITTLNPTTWPSVLANASLVAFSENAPLVRRYWRTVFGISSAPVPTMVIDDLRAIRRIVATSSSWTVLPTYLTTQAVEQGELVIPFRPRTPPTNTLYLARRTANSSAYVERVSEHLRQSLATRHDRLS